MELPKKKIKAESINPRSMVIFSQPKMGKTTLMAALEDNLIIDLEQGSGFVDALKVEVNTYSELVEVIKSLKEEKEKLGRNPYKYGTLDTVTKLETLINPLAVKLYQATPMGKKFPDKKDITTLPNGAGWKYVRDAMNRISNSLQQLFDHVIFIGHVKEKSITKDDGEITSLDLALTGKMAQILPANVDAVGYLHRNSKNDLFLDFRAGDALVAGARPEHLKGKDIQIGTYNKENNTVEYHWDKIFLPKK